MIADIPTENETSIDRMGMFAFAVSCSSPRGPVATVDVPRSRWCVVIVFPAQCR
jgi:hypothetical protein